MVANCKGRREFNREGGKPLFWRCFGLRRRVIVDFKGISRFDLKRANLNSNICLGISKFKKERRG